MAELSLIVAAARNRAIGVDNRMPWHLPADLRHFKRLTLGKPVIMGRRTFESIGRPLPDRHNIVVTRNPNFVAKGCTVVDSLDAAIDAAKDAAEIMVIGGASLYEAALPRARTLYLTQVDAEPEADTFFPELKRQHWVEQSRESHSADDRHAYGYDFVVLQRRGGGEGAPVARVGPRGVGYPAIYLSGGVIVMLVLNRVIPVYRWIEPPWSWLGVVPLVAGLLLMLWAARDFRRARTTIIPFQESTALLTGGLYRYSRNPIYVAMTLLLAGIAVMLGSVAVLVVPLIFVVLIDRLFIRPEEIMLTATFGSDFEAYRRRVRRWL